MSEALFRPGCAARDLPRAAGLNFATEGRAGVVDAPLRSPTSEKRGRACHGLIAIAG